MPFTKGHTIWKGKHHSQETIQKMRDSHPRVRFQKQCLECSKVFFVKKHKIERAKYCSKKCHGKATISKAWPGRKHTNITIQKLRLAKIGKFGIEANRYIPDRTKLSVNEHKHLDGKYKEWMLSVKRRDAWKCKINNVDCKGRLESHHILNWKDYPKLRYDINNGITLCHAHHPRGRKNEAKLSPYLQSLVAENK